MIGDAVVGVSVCPTTAVGSIVGNTVVGGIVGALVGHTAFGNA